MKNVIPITLIFFIVTSGCISPGDLFGEDEPEEIPFEYDLTIEDLWKDIPINQTSASDIINLSYELERSPRVTNLTEIGYSINNQPLLLVEFGDYDPDVPTVYFVAAQGLLHGRYNYQISRDPNITNVWPWTQNHDTFDYFGLQGQRCFSTRQRSAAGGRGRCCVHCISISGLGDQNS